MTVLLFKQQLARKKTDMLNGNDYVCYLDFDLEMVFEAYVDINNYIASIT